MVQNFKVRCFSALYFCLGDGELGIGTEGADGE